MVRDNGLMAGAVETNALIVVDVQRAFLDGAAAIPEATTVLKAIRRLVDRARHSGVLVVQLQNDGPLAAVDEADSDGWQLLIAPTAATSS